MTREAQDILEEHVEDLATRPQMPTAKEWQDAIMPLIGRSGCHRALAATAFLFDRYNAGEREPVEIPMVHRRGIEGN